jgi:hypothetical protein
VPKSGVNNLVYTDKAGETDCVLETEPGAHDYEYDYDMIIMTMTMTMTTMILTMMTI